jgi:hypothetical protein
MLSDYGPKPYQMRIGGVSKKGYDVADFNDAFASYLVPSTPVQSETPKQSSADNGIHVTQTETNFETNSKLSETSEVTVSDGVSVEGEIVSVQNANNPLNQNDCFGVSVYTPGLGEEKSPGPSAGGDLGRSEDGLGHSDDGLDAFINEDDSGWLR